MIQNPSKQFKALCSAVALIVLFATAGLAQEFEKAKVIAGAERAFEKGAKTSARFVVVTGSLSACFARNSMMPVIMANCGW